MNEVKRTYRDDVDRFKTLTRAHFASDLLSLHGFIEKTKAKKKKITTHELVDPAYVERIEALYNWVRREKDATDFYESMLRSCSQGCKGFIGGGLLLVSIPILLVLYTPDLGNSFITIGFLMALFAAFAAYASGQRVASYWRNRDRLLKLLNKEQMTTPRSVEVELE